MIRQVVPPAGREMRLIGDGITSKKRSCTATVYHRVAGLTGGLCSDGEILQTHLSSVDHSVISRLRVSSLQKKVQIKGNMVLDLDLIP